MSENSNFIENENFPNSNSLEKVLYDANIFGTTIKKRVKKKNFQCEVCQKKFSSKIHVDDHMLTHTGEKPHICDICNKKFTQKSHFKTHFLVHTRQRRFNCEICFKKFTYKQHFQQHLRTHTGEKPYECEICRKNFSYRSLIKKHMISHSEVKPFSCKVCGVRFCQKSSLKSHIMRNHAEVSRTHVCNTCKGSFATEEALQEHSTFHKLEKSVFNKFVKKNKCKEIRSISDHKKNYKCHECTETLKNEKDLQKHIQNHKLLKSFICYQCEIEFTTAYGLIKHLRSCMGEKPSVCEKNLQKDSKNNESTLFFCYQCETSFTKCYDLIKHLRTCTGEKSYASSHCGDEFAKK